MRRQPAIHARGQMLAHARGPSTRSSASAAKASISMWRASASRDAAGAQIEQRCLVEFADGGAVAALHVVGEDFELRLGVDRGAPGRAADCGSSAARRSSGRRAHRDACPGRRRARGPSTTPLIDSRWCTPGADDRRRCRGRLLLAAQQIGAVETAAPRPRRHSERERLPRQPRAERQGESCRMSPLGRARRVSAARVDRLSALVLDP